MSFGNKLRLLYNIMRSWGPAGRAAIIGGPALILLMVLSLAPDQALTVLGLMAVVTIVTAVAAGKLMEGLLRSRLEPVLDYGDEIDLESVSALGRELDQLGFTPAGLYRLRQGQFSVFLDVRVNLELKVYGSFHCAGRARPVVEFGSYYDGERIFIVDNSRFNTAWMYPDSVVNDHFPELGPTELLDVFLHNRPGLGLRPTPPEKFEEYYELEMKLVRAHLLKGGSSNDRR